MTYDHDDHQDASLDDALWFHRTLAEAESQDPRFSALDSAARSTLFTEPGKEYRMASIIYRGTPYRPISDIGDPRERRQWTARNVLSAAMALMIVGSLLAASWMTFGGRNGGGEEENTTRLAAFVESPVASPSASSAYCNVKPLTEDEAFEIALNPVESYQRLGIDPPEDIRGLYLETTVGHESFPRNIVEHNPGTPETQSQNGAIDAARQYWRCLNRGTSLQVWALMIPELVQKEILEQLPVVRSESTIRMKVEEYGDRPHVALQSFQYPLINHGGGVNALPLSSHAQSLAVTSFDLGDGRRAALVYLHLETGFGNAYPVGVLLVEFPEAGWLVGGLMIDTPGASWP